jgi:methylated-DNA-[protein]-cysteine S-methyltransferase
MVVILRSAVSGRVGRYIRRVGTRHVSYEVDGWGTGELVFADEVLVWHDLPSPGGSEPQAHPLAERLRAYFAGSPDGFEDVELELDWCTPFQRAAVEAMRSIPYGETASYGEVAALAGHPNAQRAVGSVCASNRFGLFVPCHRIVGASGLGSYGSLGPGYKRRLLELEGVVL